MPIAAVREGEVLSEDFEALFQEHCQLVFRAAYAITGHRQDAEDVLQSVFVNVLQQQGTPSRRSGRHQGTPSRRSGRQGLAEEVRQHPARYLHRAAVNASLNVLRSRKRRRLVDGLDLQTIPAGPAEAREQDERHARLADAMARLTPRALEILTLRYQHDYSDAQIAALLGTSRGVIAVTLYRIRTRLRTLDKTGVTDRFSFVLESDPDPQAIVRAVQEQLGLRLEQTRASREYLVIDSIERPGPN